MIRIRKLDKPPTPSQTGQRKPTVFGMPKLPGKILPKVI